MTSVVICDDHTVLAEALGAALTQGGYELLGVANRPARAMPLIATQQPTVVVMDLYFPDGPDGLATTETIRRQYPASRVVLLSAGANSALVRRAAAAGADGVVNKAAELSIILTAIDRVASGEFYCQPELLMDSLRPPSPDREAAELASQFLTPREREVLMRLSHGSSTAGMAEAMGIGIATVRTHVQNVLTKLGVESRLAAVAYAVAHQLVEPPDHVVSRW